MTTSEVERALGELPPAVRFAFAPLVKRALGVAFALLFGGAIFFVTAYHLLFAPDDAVLLGLLGQYFAGYDPSSWSGPFVGLVWGLWTGFVMGWFLAACRNFAVAVWIIVIRARANLDANRDFLDHI